MKDAIEARDDERTGPGDRLPYEAPVLETLGGSLSALLTTQSGCTIPAGSVPPGEENFN